MLRSGASSLPHSMRLRLKRFVSRSVASTVGTRGLLAEWGCMSSCQSRTSWLAAFMPICQSSPGALQAWKQCLEPLRLAGAKRVAAGLTTGRSGQGDSTALMAFRWSTVSGLTASLKRVRFCWIRFRLPVALISRVTKRAYINTLGFKPTLGLPRSFALNSNNPPR